MQQAGKQIAKINHIPEFYTLPEKFQTYFREKPVLRTDLNKWSKSKNFVVETKKNLPFTHTSFAGGLFDTSNLTQLKANFGDEINALSGEIKRTLFACQEEQFLAIIGQAIYSSFQPKIDANGQVKKKTKYDHVFIAEKKTPIFRLFIDLDLKSPVEQPDGLSSRKMLQNKIRVIENKIVLLTQRNLESEKIKLQTQRIKLSKLKDFLAKIDDEKLTQIVTIVQKVIKNFYPTLAESDNHKLDVIVCTTTPKIISNQENSQHKDGLHFIWPNLFVDTEKALYIRESIIYKLEHELGKREGLYNDWKDVVDEAVYGERSGGLRMIGCRKADKCKDCTKCVKGKFLPRKPNCPCDYGVFHTSRIYWPEFLFDKEAVETPELKNKLESLVSGRDKYFDLMRFTCVRTFQTSTTPGYQPPQNAPVPLPPASTKKRTANSDVRRHKEDTRSLAGVRNKVALANDHPWLTLFESLIRSKFGKLYSSIIVSQAYLLPANKDSKHSRFLITVEGEGSSYCQNLGDNHKSNKVWFYLTSEWIAQRCFCTCQVPRKNNVMCKNYTSAQSTLNNLPLFTSKVFPPLFHMNPHPSYEFFKDKNMGSMHESFLPVLWTRISRSSFGNEFDISKGDPSLNEQLMKDIMKELSGVSRRISNDPTPPPQDQDVLID